MSYLVLARKYRPQLFEDVVGQEHVTQTLGHSITANRVAHAILFAGPRGTGKTTVARILAKAMNCEKGPIPKPCNECRSCREITADSAADVFEIDGASNNSVDQVRELRDNIVFMPNASRYKIYIIDEVHMLSVSAFNALLKTLEEPPAHVLFMFATTEIRKIPITILSRCQRHDLRRIGHEAITTHLNSVCGKEGVAAQPESLSLIARQADGSMRDALSLLDQAMAGSQGAVEKEFVLDMIGGVDRTILSQLSAALLSSDVRRMLSIVGKIYNNGQNLHRVYMDLLAFLRDLVVIRQAKTPEKLIDRPPAEIAAMASQAEKVPETHLTHLFELLFREEAMVRLSPHPKMAMEMVLLKIGQTKPVLPIDTLIERLDQLKASFDQPSTPVPAPQRTQPKPGPGNSSPSDSSPPEADSTHRPEQVIEAPPKAVEAVQGPDGIWEQICQKIGETSPALAATLTGSRLILKNSDRLEIEVNGGAFNLEMVRRKKNRVRIENLLKEHFSQQKVLFVGTDTTGDKQRKASKKKSEVLKKKALDHAIVNDALEIFRGTIENVNIIQEDDQ